MPKTRKNGDHQLLARALSDRDRQSLSGGCDLGRAVPYSHPAVQQPRPQARTRETREFMSTPNMHAALPIMALTGGDQLSSRGTAQQWATGQGDAVHDVKEKMPTHARSQEASC